MLCKTKNIMYNEIHMKRIRIFILSFFMVLCLCACQSASLRSVRAGVDENIVIELEISAPNK